MSKENKIDSKTYVFKIVILGDQAVGKTSLLVRYAHKTFSENYSKTIGCDFLVKIIDSEFGQIVMEIWDLAGDDRFKYLLPEYLREADAAIFVFDLTNKRSYENLNEWIEDFHKENDKDCPILIIGNKADLNDELITIKDSKWEYITTSAKTGDNVEKAFEELGKRIYKHAEERLI